MWFLRNGEGYTVRGINAASDAEAQRRIQEGGVIGITEGGRYIFGRPGAGITVWCAVPGGPPTELADRDLETERARKKGRPEPRPPVIPS